MTYRLSLVWCVHGTGCQQLVRDGRCRNEVYRLARYSRRSLSLRKRIIPASSASHWGRRYEMPQQSAQMEALARKVNYILSPTSHNTLKPRCFLLLFGDAS